MWFASRPRLSDALRFAQYYHCHSLEDVPGLRRRRKFTTLIDLTRPLGEVFDAFSETTRYKIRRAERDGVEVTREPDLGNFAAFAKLEARTLEQYWPHLVATQAVIDDQLLVMHAHLVDPTASRVALYKSVSYYNQLLESSKRNLIGRANRLLHFRDMARFKELGIETYDMGGIAKDTADPKLRAINDFKIGFAGVLREESNYISQPVIWWNWLIRRQGVST